MDRFETQLSKVDPGFADLLRKVPPQDSPPLTPDWLRCEMLERFQVLQHAAVEKGTKVLEVGAGAHAIATVPLAYLVGARGQVVAVERERWTHFHKVVAATAVGNQVLPLACDASHLPLPSNSFDLAACVHGIRSLESEATMVETFREMLRVAPRIFLAESLPVARNEAQRAHLAMYNLREEIFEEVSGAPDDLRYLPLDQLVKLVERAGGSVVESQVLEVDLPHTLAYLSREYVERIQDHGKREDLLRRWDEADQLRRQHGTDHPPVGIIIAGRVQLGERAPGATVSS